MQVTRNTKTKYINSNSYISIMATKQKKTKQSNPKPLVFIGALVILISLAVLGFQLTGSVFNLTGIDFSGAAVSDSWFNNSWQYRTPVEITQAVAIVGDRGIAEVKLISDKVKSDCSDIRVVDSQTNQEVASKISCNSTVAVIKFEYAIGANQFYIYYGNPGASPSGMKLSLWKSKAAPTIRGETPGSANYNGLIYLIGGSKAPNAFEVYNPSTNQWTAKPKPPVNIGGGTVLIKIGPSQLVVVGGSSNLDSTWVYNTGSETWGQIQYKLLYPRAYFGAASENNNIHIFGGQGTIDGKLVYLDKHEKLINNVWIEAPAMPTARAFLAATKVSEDKIFVLGGAVKAPGSTAVLPVGTNEMFDILSEKWVAKVPMPIASKGSAVTATNNTIYVIGGSSSRALQIYDTAKDSWTSGEILPGDKRAATASTAPGKIYVMGGLGDEVGMYEYTIPNFGIASQLASQEINPNFDDSVGAQETNQTAEPETNQTATPEEEAQEETQENILDQITGKDKSIKCPEGKVLVGTTCVDDVTEKAVCGNNIREGDEMCDGPASQACPNVCTISCACKYIPNDGVCDKDVGEKGEDCKSLTSLWIGLALLLLVVGGVIIYFKYHLDLDGFDLKSVFGRGGGGSSDSEVKSYISSTESMGYSKKQIAGALKKKGWSIDVIRKYLGGSN